MKGKQSYSHKDIEQLSAYLDGELSTRGVEKLEARLSQEPELKELWDELRATRALVSSLPRVKPPRNYILAPEMVGEKPRPTYYPALRFATALAALAFVLLVGIDSFLSLSFGGAMAPSAIQMEAIAEREMAAELPPIETTVSAAEEQVEEEPAEAPVAEAEGILGEGADAGFAEEGRTILGTPAPTEAAKAAEEAQPMEPGVAVPATQTPFLMQADELLADDEEGALDLDTLATTPLTELENQYFDDVSEQATQQPISILRVVEFALAIITIILILATVTLRRRTE